MNKNKRDRYKDAMAILLIAFIITTLGWMTITMNSLITEDSHVVKSDISLETEEYVEKHLLPDPNKIFQDEKASMQSERETNRIRYFDISREECDVYIEALISSGFTDVVLDLTQEPSYDHYFLANHLDDCYTITVYYCVLEKTLTVTYHESGGFGTDL